MKGLTGAQPHCWTLLSSMDTAHRPLDNGHFPEMDIRIAQFSDRQTHPAFRTYCTLTKKKIKFSSYIRKFRMEQLQNQLWLTASSYMGKYLRISSYIRKPFLIIYDFAAATLWISLCLRKIVFSFLSVYCLAYWSLPSLLDTAHPLEHTYPILNILPSPQDTAHSAQFNEHIT